MKDKKENGFRCGMVSIVGRPNVGKSTLLNKIIGEKVAIVSKIPQTTRNQVRGVYNDERGQIIFLDTPGIHLSKDKLDKYMNETAAMTIHDADCVIYLVDANRKIGEEEEAVVKRLKTVKSPIILGLNKVDLKGKNIPEYISLWEKAKGKSVNEMKNFTLMPLSSKDNVNIERLINVLFDYMPVGPALYPEDIICDVPRKMVIADIIREKLFQSLKDEVPHSLGVFVEDVQPKKNKLLHICALIIVERDTQKEIVIGKGGRILKTVGTKARQDLEDVLESRVYLDIHVKVQKKWRDNLSLLEDLGYSN